MDECTAVVQQCRYKYARRGQQSVERDEVGPELWKSCAICHGALDA